MSKACFVFFGADWLLLRVDEDGLGPDGALDPAQPVVVGLVSEDEPAHAILQ